MYDRRIENSGIQVEQGLRARRPVRCFEGEIRRVLSNLVSKAIDAMPLSGGRLQIRSRDAVNLKTGREGVVLTIADNGEGIPRSAIHLILDAFYTPKDLGGTGLGPWVSKEIANRHGGALRVRSAQSETRSWTVFTLYLPLDCADR